MSEAMNMLNGLSLDDYLNPEPINDALIINANGRIINIPNSEIILGVVGEHNVERKYFKCPKIVGDNVDLSGMILRIVFKNAKNEKDQYVVDDLAENGDYITFSWLLSNKVLAAKGPVSFTIIAASVDEEGYVQQKWSTTLATGNVLDGLSVDGIDGEEEGQDLVAQLLTTVDEAITAANAITGKGDTDLHEAVQSLLEGYGGGGEGTTNWFPPNCVRVEEDAVNDKVIFNADGSIYVEQGCSCTLRMEIPLLPCKEGYILDFGVPLGDNFDPNFDLGTIVNNASFVSVSNQWYGGFGIGNHFEYEYRQTGETSFEPMSHIHIDLILGFTGQVEKDFTLYPNLCKGTELKPWQPYKL